MGEQYELTHGPHSDEVERYRVRCSEIWGGIHDADLDVCTTGWVASLYARSASGNRGGDIYFFSVCDNDLFSRVAVADVMGHGEAVSDVSRWMYDALAGRMNEFQGDRVLADLNRMANDHGHGALTTAAVLSYDHRDRCLSVSNAGHPPALIRPRSATAWVPAMVTSRQRGANLPLGVADDVRYDLSQIHLKSGDRIVLYTDGLIEAPDSQDRPFGLRRLIEILNSTGEPEEWKRRVVAALEAHTDGVIPDDVTFMAIVVR